MKKIKVSVVPFKTTKNLNRFYWWAICTCACITSHKDFASRKSAIRNARKWFVDNIGFEVEIDK